MSTSDTGWHQPHAESAPVLIVRRILQPIALAALGVAALVLTGATVLAIAGVLPWAELSLGYGGEVYPQAGIWVQSGLTLLALGLLAFLPSNTRILRLEQSHRDFRISMHDVTHAYHTAHAADREGVFRMSHEFDAVRERLAFLRDHPDLQRLEPEILEAAAQMSQVSRELADTYSEEKVNRARGFLRQRQEELETFNERLETAKVVTQELRHWMNAVEMEESVAQSQLDRLLAELDDILPELNLGMANAGIPAAPSDSKVVGITRPAAE